MSNSPKTQPKPQASPRSIWLRRVGRYLIYFLGMVTLLAVFQRKLMYGPTQVASLPGSESDFERGRVIDVTFVSEDGITLHGWHILPDRILVDSDSTIDSILAQGLPIILYFPGNGGNRSMRTETFSILSASPAHIFAFDYRGYGENAGKPSEVLFAQDALKVWEYLTKTRKIPADRIIIYGESLGGAVSTRLASVLCQQGTPPAGLILQSTFNTMVDAAGYHYPWLPVSLMLIDRYLSVDCIPQVTCPILALHGARDRIVPLRLGKKLFDAAPAHSHSGIPKRFVELLHSDHNDVIFADSQQFENMIRAFVGELSIRPE